MNVRLDYILASLRRAAEQGYPWSVSPTEATVLVAEVERLRAEAHTLRLWAEEAARAENANAEDAKKERAAVVAWLRRRGGICDDMADDIARGEHRREEEK